MFTDKELRQIVELYNQEHLSTYVIAERFDTYPNKIRRALIKQGVELKDKSSAQKVALESGRSEHPTEGKERSVETKIKISESVHDHWENLSPEERQLRVDKARQQWYNMTETEREALRAAAAAAVREASKTGSKLEQFLRDELKRNGYIVEFHRTGLIQNVNLEIDIYIPKLKTAIEIDGPSHFFPIWGEEKLQKHIKSDSDKAGLLLASGRAIVRIKHITKNVSEKYKRDLLKIVLEKLEQIEKKFPSKGNRYIELEV